MRSQTHPGLASAPARRRTAALRLVALSLALAPVPLGAQRVEGLPAYESLNPALVARSGLFAPAMVEPGEGWAFGISAEYGSAIERRVIPPDGYLLDAELSRVQLTATRGLGERAFVLAQWGVAGAWRGFADSFFDGYHRVIGFVMPERDVRPHNRYGAYIRLHERGVHWAPPARAVAVSDVRLAAGWRPSAWSQALVAVTLPVARDGAFARGVPTVTVAPTARWRPHEAVLVEGGVAASWAPTHGELAPVQREWHRLATVGAQWRATRTLAVEGRLVAQSAAYAGTKMVELDRGALTADVGVAIGGEGRRWRVTLSEDLRRDDPGLDLVLKVGTGW